MFNNQGLGELIMVTHIIEYCRITQNDVIYGTKYPYMKKYLDI